MCARHCSQHFICIISFHPHNNPILLFPPISQIRKLRLRVLSDVPRVLSGIVKTEAQAISVLLSAATLSTSHRDTTALSRWVEPPELEWLGQYVFFWRHLVSLRASPICWVILATSFLGPQFPKLPNSPEVNFPITESSSVTQEVGWLWGCLRRYHQRNTKCHGVV